MSSQFRHYLLTVLNFLDELAKVFFQLCHDFGIDFCIFLLLARQSVDYAVFVAVYRYGCPIYVSFEDVVKDFGIFVCVLQQMPSDCLHFAILEKTFSPVAAAVEYPICLNLLKLNSVQKLSLHHFYIPKQFLFHQLF
jgi:hypothetical protein